MNQASTPEPEGQDPPRPPLDPPQGLPPTANHVGLEEGDSLLLDFHKLHSVAAGEPVVPVVVQHARTLEVLILAYANAEALRKSLEIGQAVFFSTSRSEIWHKGATSGDFLTLIDVRVNCEQNSLLYLVEPVRQGSCHTKDRNGQSRPTCYYRSVKRDPAKPGLTLKFRDGLK